MRVRSIPIAAAAAAFVTVTLGASVLPAQAEVVLRAVTFRPLDDNEVSMPMFKRLMADINKAGKGIVRIEHIGGPEAIPLRNQAVAVGKGIADITVTITAHASIVPEVGTLAMSRIGAVQERKAGYIDLLDAAHKKLNLKVIGRPATNTGFYIFSKARISGIADFKGMKIRSHAGTHNFFRSIGAVPVNMAISEIFTGLERGVVVAAPYPLSASSLGLHEVTKFLLTDALWPAYTSITLMNRTKWDSLPQKAKDVIMTAQMKHEAVMGDLVAAIGKKQIASLQAKGMTLVSLPATEHETWITKANDARWAPLAKRMPPEQVAKIKGMISGKK